MVILRVQFCYVFYYICSLSALQRYNTVPAEHPIKVVASLVGIRPEVLSVCHSVWPCSTYHCCVRNWLLTLCTRNFFRPHFNTGSFRQRKFPSLVVVVVQLIANTTAKSYCIGDFLRHLYWLTWSQSCPFRKSCASMVWDVGPCSRYRRRQLAFGTLSSVSRRL